MSRVKLQYSDGGRNASGFIHETNDCTVKALANSTGLSYAEAHRLAKIAGRRDRHGMKKDQVAKMLAELAKGGRYTVKEMLVPQPAIVGGGFSISAFGRFQRGRRQRVGGISKSEFLWRLPKKGSFYCASTTHAFAVVDGVLKDHSEMGRAKMMAAWEVTQVYPQIAPVPVTPGPVAPQGERVEHKSLPQGKPVVAPVAPAETPERLAEMEEMKRKIARLEEMKRMQQRIAQLEKQLGVKNTTASAKGAVAGL